MSGLSRTPGKRVWANPHRGFESRPLRQIDIAHRCTPSQNPPLSLGERVFYCRNALHKASSHRIILLVFLLVHGVPTKPDTNTTRSGDTNMALTDTFIKQAKWTGKPTGDKHSDGHGLYLHVKESGK
jgi:hypothetical protein